MSSQQQGNSKSLCEYASWAGSGVRERPLSHYREAIADFLVESLDSLDIRPLWRRGDIRYFRVNLWHIHSNTGEPRLTRSVFLAVAETADRLSVTASL